MTRKLPSRFTFSIRIVALLGIVLAACQQTAIVPPPATVAVSAPSVATTVPPTSIAAPTLAVDIEPRYKDSSQAVEARVEDLLGQMTLAEKIGQMTQVENYSIAPELV